MRASPGARRTRCRRRSPSYRLAFSDIDFLLRDELRPVRLQLELLKPELELQAQGIEKTIVVFGSARIVERAQAESRLREAEAEAGGPPGRSSLAPRRGGSTPPSRPLQAL